MSFQRGDLTLTTKQDAFAVAFVTNGGNGRQAAAAAGYESPENEAVRLLCNPKVAARIKALMALDLTARLPELIGLMLTLATDPNVDAKVRYQATAYLIDRGGLALPKGGAPSVAVQVNVGDAKASEVQALIRDIHGKRSERLASGGQSVATPLIEAQFSEVADKKGDPPPVS